MKSYIGLFVLLGSILVVVSLNAANSRRLDSITPAAQSRQNLPQVHVEEFIPQLKRDRLSVNGRVNARWQTRLAAEVEGRVKYVWPELVAGKAFKQGQLLVELENSRYQLALANAELAVASAERQLVEQQARFAGQSTAAGADHPHIKEARLALSSAHMQRTRARYNLANTRITAPFDGVVSQRQVNPGDYVQRGIQLLSYQDVSVLDVQLSLSPDQIERLAPQLQQVVDIGVGNNRVQGKILSIGHEQNPINHWRQLTIAVETPNKLLPGQFVTVELTGKQRSSINIPAHYLSADGHIWRVDKQQRLSSIKPQRLFRDGNTITLAVGQDSGLFLVANPSGLLEGAEVEPILVTPPVATAEVE